MGCARVLPGRSRAEASLAARGPATYLVGCLLSLIVLLTMIRQHPIILAGRPRGDISVQAAIAAARGTSGCRAERQEARHAAVRPVSQLESHCWVGHRGPVRLGVGAPAALRCPLRAEI